jgi:hypothetical protein
MTKIQLDQAQRAFVAERVQQFEREAPETLKWQAEYVRTHGALPLYIGWTETLALRPDGSLVRWSTEQEYEGLKSIDAMSECALVLVRAAERSAVLRSVMPERPAAVEDCGSCMGTGGFPAHPDLICQCAGLGWQVRSLDDLRLEREQP